MPFSNYQPSLVLGEGFPLYGIFPPRSDNGFQDGADHFTMGMVRNFTGNYTLGTAAADGRLVPIPLDTAMFSIIGTYYGGNGTSNFALPDLRGATVIGATTTHPASPDGPYLVGQFHTSATTTLTEAQMPAHDHSLPGGGQTSVTGGAVPIDQFQPSVSMTYLIAAGGIYPGGGSAISIGQVAAFAGNFVPSGWRPADGSVLNIADFTSLYSIIGNTYGGDGTTTFALPDLRNRTIVGTGTGAGLAPVTLGESFGNVTTTLTLDQLPAHDHGLPGGGTTGSTGMGDPIGNFQPSLGLRYIVALEGVFPSRDIDPDSDIPSLGEVVAWAGIDVPRGWALADGSLLSIAQNSALFSIMGTTYGGNGIQTFALPDLRGRTIIGSGNGLLVGDRIGTESFSLTVANLPSHTHDFGGVGGVPEPASWAMLIAGFGLTGAAMRRRRVVA